MDLPEAVDRACQEPSLIDALTYICIWESERIVKQVRENYGSGSYGAWDTCFRHCISHVMKEYKIEKGQRNEKANKQARL